MAKSKNKNVSNIVKLENSQINLDIDYDKLAEAIVKANDIIKKAEKEKIENEYKKNRDEWDKILGIVEFPNKKYFFIWKYIVKFWYNLKNFWHILKTIICFKEDYVKYTNVTYRLFQLVSCFLLWIYKWIFYCFSFSYFFSFLKNFDNLNFLLLFFVFFIIGKVCRISGLEVKSLNDKKRIIDISTVLFTFTAMLFTVIGVFVSLKV